MNIQTISKDAMALCDMYGTKAGLMVQSLVAQAIQHDRVGDTVVLHAVKCDIEQGLDPINNVLNYLIKLHLV